MLGARSASEFGEFVRVAGDEEHGVAGFQSELARAICSLRLGPDVLASGPLRRQPPPPSAPIEDDIAKARLALALRPSVHPIGRRPAGRRPAPEWPTLRLLDFETCWRTP